MLGQIFFLIKLEKKYEINKRLFIDIFIKYENLKDDLNKSVKEILLYADVNELDKLKINGSYRKNKNSKKDIINNLNDSEKSVIIKSA